MVLDAFTPELARSAGLAEDRFPKTEEEADIAESALIRELQKMSIEEHERLLFGIHGIERTEDEEEEGASISRKLDELETQLNKIKASQKEAYERAKFLNKAYVESAHFRLMFLRSDAFNPKKAAATIVNHFEIKRKIFGDGDILARDVRQDDLNEEDMERLRHGFLQVLSERDAAGRTVLCLNLGFKRECELASPLSRCTWYFMMSTMKDVEAQKKGVIYVMYNYVGFFEELEFQREIHQLRNALPQKTHACHYCYDDPTLRPFVTGVRLFIDSTSRFRVRPHCGSKEDIDFELQTYGIPTEVSPMKVDGTWSTVWHHRWIQMQRAREEREAMDQSRSQSAESIIIPSRFDVLFGRGRQAKTHTGNLRAMLLCEMNYSRYESSLTGKYGKTEVAEQIVSIIHESGGRFLKPEDGGWVEVDDEAAREKISHYFRHMRAKAKNCRKDSSVDIPNSSEEMTLNTIPKGLTGSKRRVTPCSSPALIET